MEFAVIHLVFSRLRQLFLVLANAIGLVAVLGAAWVLPGMIEILLQAAA
jgi:hypothetical protein